MKILPNKIHIIGTSGSGKTTVAKNISKILDIPIFELDDMHWHNEGGHANQERNPEERDLILKTTLKENEKWILEGVYHKWVDKPFEQADIIILFKLNPIIPAYHILKRYLRKDPGHDSSIKTMWDNIVWGYNYRKNKMPFIEEKLSKYSFKVIEIKSVRDIDKLLKFINCSK